MSRQGELLAALTDHVQEQGLAELSLRPLAAAVGTTARMLIYHFGSKDELLTKIVAELRKRQRDLLARWSLAAEDDFPASFWSWLSSRRMESHARLWIDFHSLQISNPVLGSELRSALSDWMDTVEKSLTSAGWSRQRARTGATLMLSTFRGLLMDLYAAGDRARVNAAAHEFSVRWKSLGK